MKKTVLKKYAELIAVCGVNVRKGQEVTISASVDQPEFIAMLADACYKRGAKKVVVNWSYQPLTKIHYRHQSVKTLGTLEKWEEERWQHYTDVLPCRIHILSDDPEGLTGVNPKKLAEAGRMTYAAVKPYRDKLENNTQWCVAAVPGEKWAKKLFPALSKKQAVEKLWEAILTASRALEDPVPAWEKHNRELEERCAHLNSLSIESLHYTSGLGTDFTVGMIPEAVFCGGGETNRQGIFFDPNIPSEECFITPEKGAAEGVVYASMPLCYQGQLIEDFSIRFHEGKAVEWHAGKNEELLTKMLTMDEGASYLGECALVPYSSPIRQTGILFYNTLFDENAACHLAMGSGYMDTIRDFQNRTPEECKALGVNESMIHEDFMIGTSDLSVMAHCRDGKDVPVFKDGEWAF